jgi:hypothetical protein
LASSLITTIKLIISTIESNSFLFLILFKLFDWLPSSSGQCISCFCSPCAPKSSSCECWLSSFRLIDCCVRQIASVLSDCVVYSKCQSAKHIPQLLPLLSIVRKKVQQPTITELVLELSPPRTMGLSQGRYGDGRDAWLQRNAVDFRL